METSENRKQEKDQNDTSLIDMTLNLMEKTVEHSPWPRETDLLLLTNTLHKVISRKNKNASRIKQLEREIEGERREREESYQNFIKSREKELEKIDSEKRDLKEQVEKIREMNNALEEAKGIRHEGESLRKEYREAQQGCNHLARKKKALNDLLLSLKALKNTKLQKLEKIMIKITEKKDRIDKEYQKTLSAEASLKVAEEEKLRKKENVKILTDKVIELENRSSQPLLDEQERVREMVTEARKVFEAQRAAVYEKIKKRTQEEAKIKHERLQEEHKRRLESAIIEFKEANKTFYEEKKKLAERDIDIKKVRNSVLKKKEIAVGLREKLKEIITTIEEHESSKQMKLKEKLVFLEEQLGRCNDERELELSTLANNIKRYKSYLEALIHKLEEEGKQMEEDILE